jgi:hypothetical protein
MRGERKSRHPQRQHSHSDGNAPPACTDSNVHPAEIQHNGMGRAGKVPGSEAGATYGLYEVSPTSLDRACAPARLECAQPGIPRAADDVPIARRRIRWLLSHDSEVETVGEVASGVEGRFYPDRIAVRSGARISFVDAKEILYVRASSNHVEVKPRNDLHVLRETLAGMEVKPDPDIFIRILR